MSLPWVAPRRWEPSRCCASAATPDLPNPGYARLRTLADVDEERHASWLELFFDLVFVVAIAELSHELVVNHTLNGFAIFAALFVPVFVAWQGFSLQSRLGPCYLGLPSPPTHQKAPSGGC